MEDDIKEFSKEIAGKLSDKIRGKDPFFCQNLPDMIRQMIEHKLKKENWVKIETKKDS